MGKAKILFSITDAKGNYTLTLRGGDALHFSFFGMTGQGGGGSTIYHDILQYPANIDYADLRDWQSVLNNSDNYYTPYARNPWWILDNNYSAYKDDRIYGSAEFGLQLAKGLQFIARGGAFVYISKLCTKRIVTICKQKLL